MTVNSSLILAFGSELRSAPRRRRLVAKCSFLYSPRLVLNRYDKCVFCLLPLFFIPCCPAFSGPLPLALSAISFRALASGGCQLAAPSLPHGKQTCSLLGLEGHILLVQIFLFFLGRLERLYFAA